MDQITNSLLIILIFLIVVSIILRYSGHLVNFTKETFVI
jgi:hypothetical protein